jgi:hypothetical protein
VSLQGVSLMAFLGHEARFSGSKEGSRVSKNIGDLTTAVISDAALCRLKICSGQS